MATAKFSGRLSLTRPPGALFFRDGRQGRIEFSVQYVPGAARVIVKDNGIGLPAGFEVAKSNSMGLKLAASLAHQLGGKLVFKPGNGCTVQTDLAQLAKPEKEGHGAGNG